MLRPANQRKAAKPIIGNKTARSCWHEPIQSYTFRNLQSDLKDSRDKMKRQVKCHRSSLKLVLLVTFIKQVFNQSRIQIKGGKNERMSCQTSLGRR